MRLARTLMTAACVALCAAPAADAHFGVQAAPGKVTPRWGTVKPFGQGLTAGVNLPVVQSPNVRLAASLPTVRGVSGAFSHSGEFFYVSGLDSIQVFDVSDPLLPVPMGVLPNIIFENEAMTYGERRGADGKLQRFLLVGNDLYQASVDRKGGPSVGNVGGGEIIVVDVTDPMNPHVRSRVDAPTSTHTVHCMSLRCEHVYTSGGGGRFSIADLKDLDAPRLVTPQARSFGAGHFWDVDDAGIAWSTGDHGAAAHDFAAAPANPPQLTTTNGAARSTPYNDFIHHNSKRPNAANFKADAKPSLANGNVLLVTEEDYLQTDCKRAGSFQTWHVKQLEAGGEQLVPLDLITAGEAGGGLTTSQGGPCSAHWFDVHQSGVAAVAFYQAGVRFLDVRDPLMIKQHGYMTGGASEVWDAYFVPERDKAGVATGRKTDVVYTVDAVRGIDVLEVELPEGDAFPAGGRPVAKGGAKRAR